MALPKKAEHLRFLKPDIAIISEAAHPDKLAQKSKNLSETLGHPTSVCWSGENENKGLLVLSYNGIFLQPVESDTTLQWVTPYRVSGCQVRHLLAVWEKQSLAASGPVGPYLALRSYLGDVPISLHRQDLSSRANTPSAASNAL